MRVTRKSANAIDIIRLSLQRPGMGKSRPRPVFLFMSKDPAFVHRLESGTPNLAARAGPRAQGLDQNYVQSGPALAQQLTPTPTPKRSNTRIPAGNKHPNRPVYGPGPTARNGGKTLASTVKISMLQPETALLAPMDIHVRIRPEARNSGKTTLKVIASSIRKGNIIEQDGRLYVVLTAENIHPGKGTPVSQIEMRRIGDGVKISERYKTTDQVEKATVEDHNFNYLYEDGDGFHFMNAETYDQVQVSKEIVGSAAPYLQENMVVKLSLHDLNPVAIQLPQRATLEVVETEPVTKGQTASSSYKPAILSNGVRTAVPPHIGTGTRIVVMTEDGSYVERAKD
jgi:elongation factor P